MAELNALPCATDKKNTGTGDCPLILKFIRGAIEVPGDKIFTAAELATPEATLKALLFAGKSDRIYPIGGFKTLTDATEDPTFQTLGDGSQQPVREGNYNWTFQYIRGGICMSNALRSRNGASVSVLFYDQDNVIFGTRVDDGTGTGSFGLQGVPLDVFYAYPWKANDGSNVMSTRVQMQFLPGYINESIGYIKADFQVDSLNGLQNINLKVAAGPATGVVQILALSGCSQTNLFDLYGTELAAAALWEAFRNDTGAILTITSVAANPGIKGFTVTLDVTDTDYVALTAAGKVKLQLKDAATLDAADIVGYEGLPVVYTRGA